MVASDDPTEKASGRGLGILRDEGVEVVVADGELAASARLLNQAFRKHARVGRPWVLFKSAMTLDGKVATRSGDSKWISGEQSRLLAHRWRASVDAVIVGIGTALADDPQLTARPDGLQAEAALQPRRVVFDSLARLSPASQLVTAADTVPLTVVVSRAAARADTDALEAAGAQVLVATGENEPARVRAAPRPARRPGHQLGAARGRTASRGSVPRRGRDRRNPPVPGAAAAGRQLGARPARGRRRGADLRGGAAAGASTGRTSERTC